MYTLHCSEQFTLKMFFIRAKGYCCRFIFVVFQCQIDADDFKHKCDRFWGFKLRFRTGWDNVPSLASLIV